MVGHTFRDAERDDTGIGPAGRQTGRMGDMGNTFRHQSNIDHELVTGR